MNQGKKSKHSTNHNSNVAVNYVMNLAYQLLALLIPLVTTPYISRVLGSSGVGVYSYTTSIVTYFSLTAIMGTGTYGQRKIAYVGENKYERSCVFWNIVIFRSVTALIASILYFVTCIFMPEDIRQIFLIQSIVIFSIPFDIGWLFSGMEQFKILVIRNVAVKILGVFLIFLTVKKQSDLGLYVFEMLGITLIGFFTLWGYLKGTVCIVKKSDIHPFKDFREIFALFIPTIAIQVYTILDKTMIGAITGDYSQNGFYEQSEKLVKILLTVLTSLGTVMAPRMAYLYAKNNQEKIRYHLKQTFRFVFMLAFPMCLGLIVTSEQIVPWFFGPGYEEIVPLLQVFSVLIIAIGCSNVSGTQYLISTKQEKKYTISVVSGAVVNLILNIILIPRMAAFGATVASVMAELTVTITQLYFIRDSVRFTELLNQGWRYCISSFVMVLICSLIKTLSGCTFTGFLITALVGVFAYFIVLFILKDDYVMGVLLKLKKGKKT